MCSCNEKEVIITERAPKALGPYSAGVIGGHFVFVSGQLGIDPASGNLIEGGVEAETRQALLNIQGILEAAGTGLADIVKTTVFLRDINDFKQMNGVYAEFFREDPPARSTIQAGALPKGRVEIEAIAILPEKNQDG